jgi:hypothetical protein
VRYGCLLGHFDCPSWLLVGGSRKQRSAKALSSAFRRPIPAGCWSIVMLDTEGDVGALQPRQARLVLLASSRFNRQIASVTGGHQHPDHRDILVGTAASPTFVGVAGDRDVHVARPPRRGAADSGTARGISGRLPCSHDRSVAIARQRYTPVSRPLRPAYAQFPLLAALSIASAREYARVTATT